MAWITITEKFEMDIELLRMARNLGVDSRLVIGGLYKFFIEAKRYAKPDGRISCGSKRYVDVISGIDGLGEQMELVGWVKEVDRDLYLIDWGRFVKQPSTKEEKVSCRDKIPGKVRFSILKRDAFSCRYCGRRPPEVSLHIDHIVPVAHGGGDEESNLCAACKDCNLSKSDKLIFLPQGAHL